MELIKCTTGKSAENDICFAEGKFSCEGEHFFVFAITSGELTLLVKSELSLQQLHQELTESYDLNFCRYNTESWNVEDQKLNQDAINLDLEEMVSFCMENDLECYQCWHADGNEGLCEAAESDTGVLFVIVYDLLLENNFSNTFNFLEDDTSLSPVLNKINELFNT